MTVQFFVGWRSTLEISRNLKSISFCVQEMHSYLVLQEFQQLQAGFNMFRSVTFLYMAGVPRHRQMPSISMHASCIFMSSHVSASESHLILEVFQVHAFRGVEARCAQHVLPEVMISPKDLIWTGGTFDAGSIRE